MTHKNLQHEGSLHASKWDAPARLEEVGSRKPGSVGGRGKHIRVPGHSVPARQGGVSSSWKPRHKQHILAGVLPHVDNGVARVLPTNGKHDLRRVPKLGAEPTRLHLVQAQRQLDGAAMRVSKTSNSCNPTSTSRTSHPEWRSRAAKGWCCTTGARRHPSHHAPDATATSDCEIMYIHTRAFTHSNVKVKRKQ